MLIKKTIGLLIILLNLAGVGFLLYLFAMTWKEKILLKKKIVAVKNNENPIRKKKPKIVNDDIVGEDDDLLKDMNLSDLDNLDLDDFK